MTDQQTIAELQDTVAKQKQLIADITAWHMIECPHGQRVADLEKENAELRVAQGIDA